MFKQITELSASKLTKNGQFYVIKFPQNTYQVGYRCEPKGIAYPIIITIMGEDKKIMINNQGQYEYGLAETASASTLTYIEKIQIPIGIKFKLDYKYDLY